MKRSTKIHVSYFFFALLGILLLQSFLSETQQVKAIRYSQFEQYLRQGRIGDVVVSSQYLEGTLKPAEAEKDKPGVESSQPQHVLSLIHI